MTNPDKEKNEREKEWRKDKRVKEESRKKSEKRKKNKRQGLCWSQTLTNPRALTVRFFQSPAPNSLNFFLLVQSNSGPMIHFYFPSQGRVLFEPTVGTFWVGVLGFKGSRVLGLSWRTPVLVWNFSRFLVQLQFAPTMGILSFYSFFIVIGFRVTMDFGPGIRA